MPALNCSHYNSPEVLIFLNFILSIYIFKDFRKYSILSLFLVQKVLGV